MNTKWLKIAHLNVLELSKYSHHVGPPEARTAGRVLHEQVVLSRVVI